MYWLDRYLDPVTLTYILGSSDFDTFCLDVRYLLNYKAYNHQTLQSAFSQCTVLADTLTCWPWPVFCAPVPFTHFTSTFNISSTIGPTTMQSASPQCTYSADALTGWPWPIFRAPLTFTPFMSPFHMSSTVRPSTTKPYIVLLLDVLTRQVPWPVFCTPVTLTHFRLMFGISSNVRSTTTKPCIVLHLIALAWQVPWPGDLDLYLTTFYADVW